MKTTARQQEKLQCAIQIGQKERDTIRVRHDAHFLIPRVSRIILAAPGLTCGEMSDGTYAVGQMRQGCEPIKAVTFDAMTDVREYFFKEVTNGVGK
jgi:hypothetical protein